MKLIGVVPARMASSRFPGKPLAKICGRPMVEHCFERARLFGRWDGLFLATCDDEIRDVAEGKGYPVIMTSDQHTRCLDRVAEAAEKCGLPLDDEDVVVCVQGDEPMLDPAMIAKSIEPLEQDPAARCTVLTMPIIDEAEFVCPDVVKVVHDVNNTVLYTSRAPIPYAKTFSPDIGALRIYGIFAFRWGFLKTFNSLPESPLEKVESCDSNRICDNALPQKVAVFPYRPSFAVDTPADLDKVEEHMEADPLWGKY